MLVISVLLHDIAKPPTTKEEMKRGRMCITSNGHEEMGGAMSRDILSNLGFNEEFIDPVSKLIASHLAGVHLESIKVNSGKVKFVKKLSRKLHPATIQQLLYVMDADTNGRGGEQHREPSGATDMIEIASKVKVVEKQYEYILMGRHLIEAGLKPSPEFGVILGYANEAQENGEFNDVEGGKKWLADYLTPPIGVKKPVNKKKGIIALILVMVGLGLLSWLLNMLCAWKFGKNDITAFTVVFVIMMMIAMPTFDYVQNKYLKKK
jgi:tRNA nucleotidyltransferase (CCA-adding enzyme)